MRDLTIGEAARRAGVGVETIRFYERRGLIDRPQKPQGAGFRIYLPEQVKRIRFIREAQQIGFSLREIAELLSLEADPSADCSVVRGQAVAKLAEVQCKIAQMQRIGSALEALIGMCPGEGGLHACTILDTLADPAHGPVPPIKGVGPLPAAPPRRTRRPHNGSAAGIKRRAL